MTAVNGFDAATCAAYQADVAEWATRHGKPVPPWLGPAPDAAARVFPSLGQRIAVSAPFPPSARRTDRTVDAILRAWHGAQVERARIDARIRRLETKVGPIGPLQLGDGETA